MTDRYAADRQRKFATNGSLSDVAREMSLTLSYFSSADAFAELMRAPSRRIALLAEGDINPESVNALAGETGNSDFAVIVAADRVSLRSSRQAGLIESWLVSTGWSGSDRSSISISCPPPLAVAGAAC